MIKKKYLNYIDKLNLPRNKTTLITGGNSGIGFEVAKYCCYLGHKVILGVRNLERGETAKKELLNLYPNSDVKLMYIDYSKRETIIAFADQLKREKIDVDFFYSNAGVYRLPLTLNDDGSEMTISTNYLGNFLLFFAILNYFKSLKHNVKYIIVSSIAGRLGNVKYDDFFMLKKYNKVLAYNNSKQCINHLYIYIQKICENTNIIPLLVHPGIVYTPLFGKAYKNKVMLGATKAFMKTFCNPLGKAALSYIYLLQDKIKEPTFVGPRGLFHIAGYPKVTKLKGRNKNYMKTINFAYDWLKLTESSCMEEGILK